MDIKRGMDHAAKIVLEEPLAESQAGTVISVVSLSVFELVKDLSSQATMIETPGKIKSARCLASGCRQVWELGRSIFGSSFEVATIAANGDEHIGKMITEAFEKAALELEDIEKVCSCFPAGRLARMGPSPCPAPSWICKNFHEAHSCPSCLYPGMDT